MKPIYEFLIITVILICLYADVVLIQAIMEGPK